MNLNFFPVRQRVETGHITHVPAALGAELDALPLDRVVQPGMRIALTAGSRGISCLPAVMRTLIEALRERGAHPFLVPAMGSHGGATADGQRRVVESYGLGEQELGVPVVSSVETVQVGTTPAGMPVYFDRVAAEADGIIPINRIKEHTAFKGRWESGILKMMAVGLGKPRGAAEIHNWGIRDHMPPAARVILETMPILFGVGIVENGNHEPAVIAVLRPDEIESEEAELLEMARRLTPRIPLEPLHLLVVREMGKDISGTGMDLNVIGMWRRTGGPIDPAFDIIAVLDLSANTHGNAIGVGHADLITQHLRDRIDLAATYKNCLTSHNLAGGKIPITLPTEEAIFATGLAGIAPRDARVVYIRNTLELEHFWVSEALLPAVEAHPALTREGAAVRLATDAAGRMVAPHFGA